MFTLCGLAFAKVRELYQIRLLFTHENGDFRAISLKVMLHGTIRNDDF